MDAPAEAVENLILDLLEWVDLKDRTYEETMDAWRTSCPRLPVWEEATDRRLVALEFAERKYLVRLTPEGRAALKVRSMRSHSVVRAS
jgi:D-3-phosphoglycerate dehydrogenase